MRSEERDVVVAHILERRAAVEMEFRLVVKSVTNKEPSKVPANDEQGCEQEKERKQLEGSQSFSSPISAAGDELLEVYIWIFNRRR